MESENTLLKEEIARLQYLNRVLTDRLRLLEQDLSPSQHQQGDVRHYISPSQNQQGDMQHYIPPSENRQGDMQRYISPPENNQGDMQRYISPPENNQGDMQRYISPSGNSQGDKKPYRGLYQNIDDASLLGHLYTQLRLQGMKGVRRKTIRNTASALLHLSRGGTLDYHHAVKAYGYTARSATKFIIALQDWGWAARQPGKRQLLLTQKGRGIFPKGYLEA